MKTFLIMLEDEANDCTHNHIANENNLEECMNNFCNRLLFRQGLQKDTNVARALIIYDVTHRDIKPITTTDRMMFYNNGSTKNLSGSENSVMYHLSHGLSEKEIAVKRGTSESTVNKQIGSSYLKIGEGKKTQSIAFLTQKYFLKK